MVVPLPTATRILLVDDDQLILRVASQALAQRGYRVTACADPLEALAMCSIDPVAFGLIVTDANMPQLTGLELGRMLLAARPGLRMILVSGDERIGASPEIRTAGFRAFLKKPFPQRALVDVVQRVLHEP